MSIISTVSRLPFAPRFSICTYLDTDSTIGNIITHRHVGSDPEDFIGFTTFIAARISTGLSGNQSLLAHIVFGTIKHAMERTPRDPGCFGP